MRSSLIVSGGILALTGVVLYVALGGSAWLALIAGAIIIIASGFVLPEASNRIEPPAGYHFCLFCSSLVLEGAERCGHCNGLQPIAASANPSPL